MVFLGRLLLAAALLGTVGSTLRHFPHQLAYFNGLAGGPANGWRHMLGSSVDWSQDMLLLEEWQRDRGINHDALRVEVLTPTGLLSYERKPAGPVEWEVISPNRATRDSQWLPLMANGEVERIGCVLWARRCSDDETRPTY